MSIYLQLINPVTLPKIIGIRKAREPAFSSSLSGIPLRLEENQEIPINHRADPRKSSPRVLYELRNLKLVFSFSNVQRAGQRW